ncbi:hypothetical protein PROFUN_00766 [Planoprotostelium fungivorum]|uniref:Uncharacterized protein n=1 Tax=Planoprotostelium fungivorum TaxID=1890364 RepID=A0A2P6NUA4_9EUKA|nr:hypothetical protein PROFUN_00766 [Planoprotostelium fungivorum]
MLSAQLGEIIPTVFATAMHADRRTLYDAYAEQCMTSDSTTFPGLWTCAWITLLLIKNREVSLVIQSCIVGRPALAQWNVL